MTSLKRAQTVFYVYVLAATAAAAQTFTTLVNFDGTDGNEPQGALVQGSDGNLYGTTLMGGTDTYTCTSGCGSVFRITPGGAITSIHSFIGTDGIQPNGVLIPAANGLFYGTTYSGGKDTNCAGGVGCGTVFAIGPNGVLTTLYNFAGPDGAYPEYLVVGIDGDYYGTTTDGGLYGGGTFFKITRSGVLTTLRNLQPGTGQFLSMVLDPSGNFYGTSFYGGANNFGAIVEITPAGAETILHSFDSTDGAYPDALLVGSDGNLYGTTSDGGTDPNGGTVFRLTTAGALITLHNFAGTDSDPLTLIQGSDGNFYGATVANIFRVTLEGKFTALATFDDTNGETPLGLVQATGGVFYGTTAFGGDGECACGTIYSLATGLSPFVVSRPNLAKVGDTVHLLGSDLTGASSVTFHGTPSPFVVLSPTEISTTVPTGATTGRIGVTTPEGALVSASPFVVFP